MADASENKLKGQFDKMKGKAKEDYGKWTNNKKEEMSGKLDKVKGKMKTTLGEFQEKHDQKDD